MVFAANHQSHMDGPVILWRCRARWRVPHRDRRWRRSSSRRTSSPRGLPRRELVHQQPELLPRGAVLQRLPAAAARSRHAADAALHRRAPRRRLLGPDLPGRASGRTTGEISPFRAGIGMIGARLDVPVVPVRHRRGSTRCCTRRGRWPKPGPVRVTFGAPLRLRRRRLRRAGHAGRGGGPALPCEVSEHWLRDRLWHTRCWHGLRG